MCLLAGVAGLGDGAVRAEPVGAVPVGAVPVGAVPVAGPVAVPGQAPAAPARLTLPRRDVAAPVVPVAVDAAGALGVPDPPTTVGWWSAGARPGDATGTVVVVGHVDSRTAGLGTFAVLPRVEPGEPVELAGTDGRTVRYRVVARRQYPKAGLPAEVFAQDGPARLVLVTCGGRFDRARGHYTDNVVVYALPAPGS